MHLEEVDNGYRLRLRVPDKVRKQVKRRQLRYTIPTKNRAKAQQIARQTVKRLKGFFVTIEEGGLMSIDISKLTKQYIKEGLRSIEEHYEQAPTIDEDEFDRQQEALSFLRADHYQAYACRNRKFIQPTVDSFLKAKGIDIDKNSPEYRVLCTRMLEASVQLLDTELNHWKVDPLTGSKLNDSNPGGRNVRSLGHTIAPPQAQPQDGPSLESVLTEYWTENEPSWSPRTRDSYQA